MILVHDGQRSNCRREASKVQAGVDILNLGVWNEVRVRMDPVHDLLLACLACYLYLCPPATHCTVAPSSQQILLRSMLS